MKPYRVGLACLLWLAAVLPGQASFLTRFTNSPGEFDRVNKRLKGRVLDYTFNHGHDCRIWSAALHEKRDLYIYLPPGYDPHQQYPLAYYLHGFGQDEHSFLGLVDLFDSAVASGQVPPVIIVAPDGSVKGKPAVLNAGSFYVNSRRSF